MPAVSTLNVPVSERDVRMLTTLLASTDPCKRIAHGASPEIYTATAREVLATLDADGGVVDVLLTLPEAEVETAHKFAAVAVHWWQTRVVGVPRGHNAYA